MERLPDSLRGTLRFCFAPAARTSLFLLQLDAAALRALQEGWRQQVRPGPDSHPATATLRPPHRYPSPRDAATPQLRPLRPATRTVRPRDPDPTAPRPRDPATPQPCDPATPTALPPPPRDPATPSRRERGPAGSGLGCAGDPPSAPLSPAGPAGDRLSGPPRGECWSRVPGSGEGRRAGPSKFQSGTRPVRHCSPGRL